MTMVATKRRRQQLRPAVRPGVHANTLPVALALAGLMGIALAARFAGIGREPLWLDEAYSHWFAGLDLHRLWTETPGYEVHPPLYYTLLHLWTAVAGTGEAGLRSLSAVVNVAALPFVFLAARLVAGTGAGLLAALVFALMPVQVEWSQNARPYGLTALPLAAILWALLALARADTYGGAAAVWRPGVRGPWLALALGSAGLLWLHNSYPLAILTVQGLALAWWLGPGRRDRRLALAWIAVNGVAFLLWAPWVPHLLATAVRLGEGFVIPAPTVANVLSWLALFFTLNDLWHLRSPWALADLLYAAAALGGFGWLAWHRDTRPAAIALAVLCTVPLTLYLLVSLLYVPVVQPKLLAWTGVPWAVLVGVGLAALPGPRVRLGAVAAVVAGMLAALAVQSDAPPREAWDRAAAILAADWRPGEPVLTLSMSAALPLGYYLDRQGAAIRPQGLPVDWPDVGPNGPRGFRRVTAADAPAIRALLRGADTVWLVRRTRGTDGDRTGVTAAELANFGRLDGRWDLPGVQVVRYRRAPTPSPPEPTDGPTLP